MYELLIFCLFSFHRLCRPLEPDPHKPVHVQLFAQFVSFYGDFSEFHIRFFLSSTIHRFSSIFPFIGLRLLLIIDIIIVKPGERGREKEKLHNFISLMELQRADISRRTTHISFVHISALLAVRELKRRKKK